MYYSVTSNICSTCPQKYVPSGIWQHLGNSSTKKKTGNMPNRSITAGCNRFQVRCCRKCLSPFYIHTYTHTELPSVSLCVCQKHYDVCNRPTVSAASTPPSSPGQACHTRNTRKSLLATFKPIQLHRASFISGFRSFFFQLPSPPRDGQVLSIFLVLFFQKITFRMVAFLFELPFFVLPGRAVLGAVG